MIQAFLRPRRLFHHQARGHRRSGLWLLSVLVIGGCSGDPKTEVAERDVADSVPFEPDSPESSTPTLSVGDPAPPIRIATWIKGEPVEGPLEGKVHVVEFWATWCGPCLANMPHLSQLAIEYGDSATFVGVTREDEETVRQFLKRDAEGGKSWDEVISYRLAIDAADQTNAAYMQAAGQTGIPCAFLVGKDGIVEWIGHPARIDQPLAAVVAGTWDRAAAVAEMENQRRLQELAAQLSGLVQSGQLDAALAKIREAETTMGPNPQLTSFEISLLEQAGRREEASQAIEKLVDISWEEPNMLNAVAWRLATQEQPGDLDLALRAAQRGVELTNEQDASVLDTLARVHFERGNLEEAVRWQTKAMELGSGHPEIEESLNRYREALEKQSAEPETNSAEPESGPESADAAESSAEPAAETVQEVPVSSPGDE